MGFLVALWCLVLVCGLEPARLEAKENGLPMSPKTLDHMAELMRGVGVDHMMWGGITYHPSCYFNDESGELEERGSGAFELTMAMNFLPTMFGTVGGMEATATLGTPFFSRSYFGGIGGDVAIVIQPVNLSALRVSVALGAGFNAHSYASVKPRVAVRIVPNLIDAELSWRLIPAFSSHVFGVSSSSFETPGFGENRLRANLFIRVGKKQGHDDLAAAPYVAPYFERVQVSGGEDEMLEHHFREGVYWGGGVGVAY